MKRIRKGEGVNPSPWDYLAAVEKGIEGVTTGVGEARPAGQIRPAEATCPARGAIFGKLNNYI